MSSGKKLDPKATHSSIQSNPNKQDMLKKIKIFLKNHQNLDIRKKRDPYWKPDKKTLPVGKMVPSHIR